MDNTEHYGCFDKGSNPLGTSVHKNPLFMIREHKKKVNNKGELSEWLGRGLQNLLHWFESNIHLGGCGLMVRLGFVVPPIRVRFSSITPHIAGRKVPNRSHKPCFPSSFLGPATKYF
jgi:hypothetical protein